MHTFEELLAGILLEECFVGHGFMEVVNHELEDRLNLLFRVASIMRQGGILVWLPYAIK